jgi:hypothetical protein
MVDPLLAKLSDNIVNSILNKDNILNTLVLNDRVYRESRVP